MDPVVLSPTQKALQINLDPTIYGTFAEIGAGQEVVRHFLEPVEHLEQSLKQCLLTTKILVMQFMARKQVEDMFVSRV